MTLEERNAKLEEAKQLVLRGWCQGACFKNEEGRAVGFSQPSISCCALGAIWRVMEDSPFGDPFHLCELVGKRGFDSVGGWNDEPGRTVEEVAALFDRAKELPL